MKILLAADGSEYTKRAALHLVKHLGWFAKPPEIHLLHVRPPIPYPGAAARAGKKAVDEYERAESLKALAVAEKMLDKAGIKYRSSWRMGDIATAIADHVKKQGIDLVVIGSHGHGALASLALGSVAMKVIASVKVPVLIVR
jgi:nucleotide-binding universal stress UspA family protein